MKYLIPVLESLSIGTAISLDDDYDTAYDPATQGMLRIEDFLNPPYRERFTEAEISEIEDSDAITISDLFQCGTISADIKEKMKALLVDLKAQQTPRVLQFLEAGFMDSSVTFQKCPSLKNLNYDSGKGTIWFIDKEISRDNILPKVIPTLWKECGHKAPVIIVVFTSDDSLAELNGSWIKRRDFLAEDLGMENEAAKQLAYSFFVVLKSEISKLLAINEYAARKYLSKILTASMSGYCTWRVIREMHNNADNAFDRLLEIAKDSDQRTFQNIHYNMIKEGEPNFYHAIKSIFDYMEELEYTVGCEQYSPYIMAMKRLARIPPHQDAEALSAQTLKDILCHYEWTQFQFIHRDVNRNYADIAHGDVFKLNCSAASDKLSSHIGVLITQPCDCVIRKDKKITQRSASAFTLVLFDEEHIYKEKLEQPAHTADDRTISNWINLIRKLRNGAIVLSNDEREDGAIASYIDACSPQKAIQIPPFILDLASLNIEGKAVLLKTEDLKLAVNQHKTGNWIEYYPLLEKELDQHRAQIQLINAKLGKEAMDVLCSLYGVAFSLEDCQFCVERIGHLEDNMAELISYNYITHAYRAGKNSLLSLNFDSENGEGDF